MSLFTYSRDIPNGPNNPSVDQPKMKINTNSTFDLIDVDHVTFNANNGGYHTIIHQGPESDPAPIAGIGQTYVKTEAGDQQLFFESGDGLITQLTGPVEPLDATNGYTVLPGGFILQWGFVLGTHASGGDFIFNGGDTALVTFPVAFPNNVFSISTLPMYGSTLGSPNFIQGFANVAVNSSNISVTTFRWVFITDSSKYVKFFWQAIGN